tara:strand:- start:108 stop:482 length:375 start_codon:yes stop_codon:yes gene_type:complete
MILIADIVLLFHFFIVVFITFGFVLIPIGYNFDWLWIKNKKLRLLHFGMMIFITFETLLGIACPLTILENNLRGVDENQLFISIWISEIIYWDFPSNFFIILYFLFLGWTFLIWKKCPPIENNV